VITDDKLRGELVDTVGPMVTTYTFPRLGQTTDWVKFLGDVPKMTEITFCAWITPFSLNTTLMLHPFSYATSASDNTFYIEILKDSLFAVFIYDYQFKRISFKENVQTHICVAKKFAAERSWIKAYQNGVFVEKKPVPDWHNNKVYGGGSLVFGQEQDFVNGGFQSDQCFSGRITNFLLWDRILNEVEIFDLATKCKEPVGVVVKPEVTNVKVYGEAQVIQTPPSTCPLSNVTSMNPCETNPCLNDGTCRTDFSSSTLYVCECSFYAQGDHCESVRTSCTARGDLDRPIAVGDEPGYIFSPNYPEEYGNLEKCVWRLAPAYQGLSKTYVQLRIISFDIAECCDKFIIKDNGQNFRIKRGSENDTYTAQASGEIVVRFTSDDRRFTHKGFFLVEYRQVNYYSKETTVIYEIESDDDEYTNGDNGNGGLDTSAIIGIVFSSVTVFICLHLRQLALCKRFYRYCCNNGEDTVVERPNIPQQINGGTGEPVATQQQEMEPLNNRDGYPPSIAPSIPGERSPPPNYDNYEDVSKPSFDLKTSILNDPPRTEPPADLTSENNDDSGGDGGLPPPPSYDEVNVEPTAYANDPPQV